VRQGEDHRDGVEDVAAQHEAWWVFRGEGRLPEGLGGSSAEQNVVRAVFLGAHQDEVD
jgi:hypothetical protein